VPEAARVAETAGNGPDCASAMVPSPATAGGQTSKSRPVRLLGLFWGPATPGASDRRRFRPAS